MFAYLRAISYVVVFSIAQAHTLLHTCTSVLMNVYFCCAVKPHLSFHKINLFALTAGKWNNHQVIDVCDSVNDESVLSCRCQHTYLHTNIAYSMPFGCLNGVLIYGAREISSWRTYFKSIYVDIYSSCFESDLANWHEYTYLRCWVTGKVLSTL